VQKKSLILLAACLLTIFIIGGCTAMENKTVTTTTYPNKPITLIVPFGVGSGIDLVARALEKSAFTHLGQSLIVINKPGGAGTIGWNEVAGAPPDGYTLGITGIDIILQPLYGPTKYHYPSALEPIAQITEVSLIMAVQSDQPWKNLGDLIDYAKKHPGEIKFGHPGIGGMHHVLGKTFAKAANIQLEQVPFQGGAEAMSNLLGGHIQVVFLNPAAVKEHLKSGKVRALAIGGEQRLIDPVFANIPTFREQGLDIVCNSWNGIAAPKGLPTDVKNKLTDGFKAIINDPEFKKNIEQLGLQVNYLGPKESEEKWLTDSQISTKTVQETGILDEIKAQKK
jgi:tripartite-type tricarboxylate transporter receptor subunit TctC